MQKWIYWLPIMLKKSLACVKLTFLHGWYCTDLTLKLYFMATSYNFVDLNLFYLRYSHSFTIHLPVIQIWCQTGHIRSPVQFQADSETEESLVFRLLLLNQNFVSRTFQPLQAYSPSQTKFFYVSMFRWMEILFIGLAFLKTWSMVLCVTLLLRGLERLALAPVSKKLFTGRRVRCRSQSAI